MTQKQSSDYWERRRAQEQAWIKDNLKNDEAFNTKLRDYYERALDRIQAEIDSELAKLVGNDEVDVTNAQKSVSAEDMKRFEREAKELVVKSNRLRKQGKFVTYDDFSHEENARMKVYNVTMRVNRLEYLKAQVGLFLVDLGSDVGHELAEKLTDDYISEVKRQAGILGANLDTLWTGKEVAKIIMAQTGSATFSQRLWANLDALKAELDGVIASGIIQGDNPREMARRLKSQLKDTVENHKYITERLARTESARVQFNAQMQSLKEAGYKYCMWHDEPKACSTCQTIAQHKSDYGTGIYELEKVPSIPVHPNCRCSISAYWVDESEHSGMPMNLQFFAGKKNDRDIVNDLISSGKISNKLFHERKKEFDNAFKKGIKTPIETVKNKGDRYYHIIARHYEDMFNENATKNIIKTLKTPNAIYETFDKNGNKGRMYVMDIKNPRSLIVIVRNGIITSYRPSSRYLTGQKERGKKIWPKD